MVGILLNILPFFVGAAYFSFCDLLVWRMPRHQRVLLGRSRCEHCGNVLPPQDLIPVVGWLLRRGHCRFCGSPIPVRCLGMELLGGAIACLTAWHYGGGWRLPEGVLGLSWHAWWAMLVTGLLIVIARLDLQTGIIPDPLNVVLLATGIWAGFLFSVPTCLERLVGGLCISLPLYLLCMKIPDAFGGGDIKLMAAAGVMLGWQKTVLAFCLALFSGGAVAGVLLLGGRIKAKDHLAFGPYLCLGIEIAMFFGDPILAWYLG